ncbi:MAG: phosphate acetyltransferase, partial [Clostridia bacterium]|nr:phosphate acetyltransferase [Clostridia bacterium]
MSQLIETYKQRAKALNKTVVLPEGEEPRVIKAASIIAQEGFAKIVILGKESVIKEKCPDVCLDGVTIIDPQNNPKINEYAEILYNARKSKGMTEEQAMDLAKNNVLYQGVLMVKAGDADGMVGGAIHSTGDLLRPALQIIKTAPGISTASGYFIIETKDKDMGSDGIFLFADCAINPNPTAEQLADIAVASALSAKTLLKDEPKVAMLSFSTKGSAKHDDVTKVQTAANLAKEKAPDMMIDGELQLDAALVPEVASLKAPGSKVAGQA